MREDYDVRKKYCPAKQKNVVVKVHHPGGAEECTERQGCETDGGCRNAYLHSAEGSDASAHSP